MVVTVGEATALCLFDFELAQTRAGLRTKDPGLTPKTGQPILSYPWEGRHLFCL